MGDWVHDYSATVWTAFEQHSAAAARCCIALHAATVMCSSGKCQQTERRPLHVGAIHVSALAHQLRVRTSTIRARRRGPRARLSPAHRRPATSSCWTGATIDCPHIIDRIFEM